MSKGKVEKKEEGVKVYLRIRPFNKKEIDAHGDPETMPTVVTDPVDSAKMEFLDPAAGWSVRECMSFDEIFWSVPPSQYEKDDLSFATQEYVYERTGRQCLDHAFNGYNSCMLAYGQTGSGKTHSMMGTPDDEGIIPRLCKELFDTIHEKQMDPAKKGTTFKVMLSFLEIYNEKVKDLLVAQPEPDHHDKVHEKFKDLKIRQHPTKGPFVDGLTESEVTNWKRCSEMIAHGFAARTTKATAMNSVSSRSHAIFKLELTQSMKTQQRGPSKQVHTISSINLVDLAGSERANRTGASGDTLTEGIAINQSLSVLRKVIEALMENGQKLRASKEAGTAYKPQPPPYRESTLTWLLSESFGGNSKTMMIAAASPHESNAEETLQTLKYALKTREIVNTVQRNEDKGMRMLREKNEEIARLMAQLENASMNPASNPAEVEEITHKLKEEQAIKKQLQEDHDKLTQMMEEKEEEMKRTMEELGKQQEMARSEAEQRAKTQRAANILGKWTRGFALSLDSSKNKKIQERDTQLKQKEEELASERAAKKKLEEDTFKMEKARKELEETLGKEKADLNNAIQETTRRLQEEHDTRLSIIKSGLQEDNERLRSELYSYRAEHTKKVTLLEEENRRLFEEAGKQSEEYKTAREGLESNAACLVNLKGDNKLVRQELYDLQEANVRLREENSKIRLHYLQMNSEQGPDNRPTQRDLQSLERRVASLLEDKTTRLKEIAFLKADKKALTMEHKEMQADTELSKKANYALQGKLQSAENDAKNLRKQLQDEDENRRHKAPSHEDEQIIELAAQNELLKRAKTKLEYQLEEMTVEKEAATSQLNLLLAKDDSLYGPMQSSGSGPEGSGRNILQMIKIMDGKVGQCKKTLLELRMQPPATDYETELERAEAMQTQIAHLLSDVTVTMGDTYEAARLLMDRGLSIPRSPVLSPPGHEMSSSFHTDHFMLQLEHAESRSAELTAMAEGAQGKFEAAQAELLKVREELSIIRSNPPEPVTRVVEVPVERIVERVVEVPVISEVPVEKVVEVPVHADLPPDMAALQEELEDAKAEAEFQEEMKTMLEEQLDDFKDFEARYKALKGALEGVGVEGDPGKCSAAIVELKEQASQLAVVQGELEAAAPKEELEFYTAKARVLEETVNDLTASQKIIEKEMLNAKYELQVERDRQEEEKREWVRREEGIGAAVNEKFKMCKSRHTDVWNELVETKRQLAGSPASPELSVEDAEVSLLDRHERLTTASKNLASYMHTISPHLTLTEPSQSPDYSNQTRVLQASNRTGIPTPTTTPRFAYSTIPQSHPAPPPIRNP